MSDPVELAEKKSGKSKNSLNSKKSKKSNTNPQVSSEKGEIKSHNSQTSQNKNVTIEENQATQKDEMKPIVEENNPEVPTDIAQPTISVRAYLEQNVTAVVQEALLEVARKRPPNPLQFVGNYILERANGQ